MRYRGEDISLGTTIIAATYNEGVVLGADARSSAGKYVANRAKDKLMYLADNIIMLRSGAAADTTAIGDEVQVVLAWHQGELGEAADVKTAAHLVHQTMYRNKDHLQAGVIVAGWDKHKGGQVYAIPMGGTIVRTPFTTGGSGSAYIYAWCDKHWRNGMTEDECKQFIVTAVVHAMARDSASGGAVRTCVINRSGQKKDYIPWDKLKPQFGELPVPPRVSS